MTSRLLKTLFICAVFANSLVFAQSYIETFDVSDFLEKPYTPQKYVPYADEEIEREAEMVAAANGHASRENATMTSTSFVN